jgi:HD-GYP domain-containing protein (c-di-GMP phosphodiesterase class II)
MKTHTTLGAKIIEQVPELQEALPIVRSHHERWDGHGYPDGLKGEDIPRLARIVAVANAFDVEELVSDHFSSLATGGKNDLTPIPLTNSA